MSKGLARSRGKAQTELLRANINDQVSRLLDQLEDLEELKDEFEEGEYEETKEETMAQLREFQEFLERSVQGDMSLVSEYGATILALQAAISQAFKTPEVIRMFAKKQPDALRKRLAALQRDKKIRQISPEKFQTQAVEVLIALKKLGSKLTMQEQAFLDKMSSARHMEDAVDKLGSGSSVEKNLISKANAEISKANTEK
mmetsp:Transcript_18900/g.26603  ORF Transcript_18900/g.26603 Transcript_18900/m.26603 type:complete len:200 (-) Transcript_18900:242-841(-)